MENQTIVLLSLVVTLSILSFFILDSILLSRLKRFEPNVYEALDKPSLFVHMSAKYSYWFSFLLLGNYKEYELSDQTVKLCRANRMSILLLLILAAVLFSVSN